jgi:hypothetical protein
MMGHSYSPARIVPPPSSELAGGLRSTLVHCYPPFRADLKAIIDLVADPETDLFAPIPHGQGRTVLREALSVADHNAYHPGQLATVRRLLGAWHDESAGR